MGHADLPPPTLAVEISECVVMMLKNVYVKILNFCFHSDWREISHPEQILASIFMLQLLFVSLIKHNSEDGECPQWRLGRDSCFWGCCSWVRGDWQMLAVLRRELSVRITSRFTLTCDYKLWVKTNSLRLSTWAAHKFEWVDKMLLKSLNFLILIDFLYTHAADLHYRDDRSPHNGE